MSPRKLILIVAALAIAALVPATSALSQGASDTTITVKPATQLQAGETAPFDAPGVRSIRRGKPIPAGYRIVKRDVSVQRGSQAAWGAMRLACPSGTKTRTLARTGEVGAQLVGKYFSTFVRVIVDYSFQVKPGQTVSGAVYLVCR